MKSVAVANRLFPFVTRRFLFGFAVGEESELSLKFRFAVRR